jgi:F-type H+-transporting ATPase subunit delta
LQKSSKNKVARIYATALLEAAEDSQCLDKVWADMQALRDLLRADSSLESYLNNPLWSEDDKNAVLQETAQKMKLSEDSLNCLKVVTENHRIGDLSSIIDMFAKLYYQSRHLTEVEVETAQALSDAQNKKLVKVLSKLFASDVVVHYAVNPQVLGGLRIRQGSLMYDDTLAHKLNALDNLMKGK